MALQYAIKHSVNMRVPLSLFEWLVRKGDAEQMPPGVYARKLLEDAANRDLQREKADGPEAA